MGCYNPDLSIALRAAVMRTAHSFSHRDSVLEQMLPCARLLVQHTGASPAQLAALATELLTASTAGIAFCGAHTGREPHLMLNMLLGRGGKRGAHGSAVHAHVAALQAAGTPCRPDMAQLVALRCV